MKDPNRPGVPLAVLSTLVLAAVVLALAGGLFLVVDRVLEAQVRADLRAEAAVLSQSMAATSSKLLWNFDDEGIRTLGDEVFRNPIVVSVEIRNDQDVPVYLSTRPGPSFERLRLPVFYQTHWAGSIIVVTSEEQVHKRIAAFEAPAFLAGGLLMVLVLVTTPFVMVTTVLRPFSRLGRRLVAVDPRTLPDGAFATRSRIREVRLVEGALRTLVSAVKDNVRTLEDRVEERTSALRAAQARLVHAEALATMGQLASGVSHELNTPLAAVLSSARTLRGPTLDALVDRLAVPPDRDLFHRASSLAPVFDARKDRKARSSLRAPWVASGRDPETALFDLLATDALAPVAQAVLSWDPGSSREENLFIVLTVSRFLGIIEASAEKGARVVEALKDQLDRPEDEEPVWFDGTEALDRCLLLQEARTGREVQVRRDLPPTLAFYGPEGRLGQVWLNLIANALQAVGTRGWIEVGGRSGAGRCEVWVADSGDPVPSGSLDRLFEPYFTTKSGALGLGLHLCRTTIEALGGEVRYEDQPRKAFRVWWPTPTGKSGEGRLGPPGPAT